MLQVLYLVFNEGYSATSGASLTRPDLSGEAIRLGRLLVELLPEPEAVGLLALMLLHESRRAARASPAGDLVLLDDQDRSLWNRDQIAEGLALVERALRSRRFGPYTLQAAISAVHAEAPDAAATDWAQIVALYDVLARVEPSPVVELNRAAAVAMRDGPAAGLALIDAILERGDLVDYYLAHSARAELCRRLGRTAEARASYEQGARPHPAGAGAAVPAPAAGRAVGRCRCFDRLSVRPDVDSATPRATSGYGRSNHPSPEDAMKYICLGYLDEKQWETVPASEQTALMDECFAYDDVLREGGHFAGGEALQSPRNATTLRWKDGKVSITDGPYAETKEQLGGILILEATDLNHAIQLMSKHPGVRVGPFEIRPAADLSEMIRESERRRSS